MAAAIVDAIGIFSAALTTIGFFQSNWPGNAPEGATVNIKAGLPELGNEGDSLGGSINHVYAFDERNGYSGQSDGCDIDSGGICTRTVDQSVGGRRAGYISVSANNDAVCIAWITVQQFDGTRGGAWTGDIGYGCGQDWYNSVEPAGRFKDEQGGGEYVPKCTWLDADHTNDIANAALKFDVSAYGENVVETANNNACAPTIYGPDNGPLAGQPGKRSTRERPSWMTVQLIVSNHTTQPAAELCNSATSWGPDFVGPDGNFCDMESKTLAPLCSAQDVDGCVEVNESEGTLTKRLNIARRTTNVVHKSYKKISKWGQ
ncbi:hypothetical protein BCR34DRAFT_597605 [Clohesyomyces aquaticus]|uniref:Uncharacterized protein n=1 Tax=Clohesyomyces aquaticus TaxID=1231657 RepID=A0A1Y2A2A2_9PLEO|nr:hypothetical protein BCR34DRAFT_597605 [Clohesyomyces aquaticus]